MMKHFFFLLLLVFVPAIVSAQSYSSVRAPALVPTIYGDVALADFDGDGDLDLVVSGREPNSAQPVIRLYRSDGMGSDGKWLLRDTGALFPESARYLSGSRASSIDVGDFDNDGMLDILVSGNNGTVVYRNEGVREYRPIVIHEEPNTTRTSYVIDIVTAPSAAWGDYDNDGDQDVLLTSRSGAFIYRNDGSRGFVAVDSKLPPLPNGIVSWGDYDNDGDLDVLAVGRPFQEQLPFTKIFRNDGGLFVDADVSLPGIVAGSVEWGDYDNDGDLDILIMSRLANITGTNSDAAAVGIYRNDGGRFVRTEDVLPIAWNAEWVDYDNDGDLDVLLNGVQGPGTFAQFVRNDGGAFQQRSHLFDGVWYGGTTAGDMDGDGAVDVLMMGRFQVGAIRATRFLFYRNTSEARMAAPPAPEALSATRDADRLMLSWRPNPLDAENGRSVTYNVRVGTKPGASDVVASMSLDSGTRLIPERGNADHSVTRTLQGLNPGRTYYWSVQAVDHRQVGSSFAPEESISPAAAEPPAAPVTENYPNPFNPSTTIRYTLNAQSNVRVVVYNVLGAQVAELVNDVLPSGTHEAEWHGTDAAGRAVPSGVYLYAIETSEGRVSRSMLLLK